VPTTQPANGAAVTAPRPTIPDPQAPQKARYHIDINPETHEVKLLPTDSETISPTGSEIDPVEKATVSRYRWLKDGKLVDNPYHEESPAGETKGGKRDLR
jgi:hypothetical protein